jgi:hypothetical protein
LKTIENRSVRTECYLFGEEGRGKEEGGRGVLQFAQRPKIKSTAHRYGYLEKVSFAAFFEGSSLYQSRTEDGEISMWVAYATPDISLTLLLFHVDSGFEGERGYFDMEMS